MTPERYQRISELYHAARVVEPERRRDFLIQACGGDGELLGEVTKLLAGSEKAGDFLDAPAVAVAAEVLASTEAQSFIGKRLGRFEILSLLGAGGMGEVYLAQDAQLGRRVALKLLPQEFTSHSDRLLRFEREARAASSLNHPNIITIHDIGEAEGIHFIATEYIEGDMLRRRIARGRLPMTEAIEIAIQVANALEIAHQAGIIHRDIKPENIMVRPDGYVKVLDFGLAKLTEPKKAMPATSQIDTPPLPKETSAGMIVGTVNYMSPEQARGLKVDRRCDLWSLGVTLYEMVVGKSPFTGQTATDIIISIVDRQPLPLTQVMPEAPAELERIVMKALAKNCDERYQSAKDMAIDLKHLKRRLESSPAMVPAPQAGVAHSTLQTAIHATEALQEAKTAPMQKPGVPPAHLAIAALLVVMVGLVAWFVFRPNPSAPISTPTLTSTPAPTVQAAPERQISYSLTIQKTNNGKDLGKPYEALEQDTFESGDRFQFKFSSPQEGYLYLLNEDGSADKSYSLLFPSPFANQGSAHLRGKQPCETGRYSFEENKPVENVLLIWSRVPVAALEAVKQVVNRKDLGKIKDPKQLAAVKAFLEQHEQSTGTAVPDQAAKQIFVQGSGDVLLHLIKLTHN
jgi:serine/threonine protein kinase